VPEWALDLGLMVLAIAIAWLAGWLWRSATAIDDPNVHLTRGAL